MRSEEDKKESVYFSLCIWRSCGAELMSTKMQHQPEGRIASEFKDAVCKSSINPALVGKNPKLKTLFAEICVSQKAMGLHHLTYKQHI